jgi:hypothetical protein
MENVVEIDIDLKKEDWSRFIKYIQKKKQRDVKGVVNGFWKNMILWCILTIIFIALFKNVGKLHYPTATFMFVLFAAIGGYYFLHMVQLQKTLAPSENGLFIGKHHFRFDQNGIISESRKAKSHYKWEAILSVVHENDMILLFVDTAYAIVFPEKQVGDPEQFMKQIKELRA